MIDRLPNIGVGYCSGEQMLAVAVLLEEVDPQRRAAAMARAMPPPARYRWQALWWRLEAKRGYPSGTDYARNLLRLARDMAARPEHYRDRLRRRGETDFQWSQKYTGELK